MMFFNTKSEINKIREETNNIIAHFEKCDEMINNRVTDLYKDVNTSERNLDDKINREVSHIEKRIDVINNDIRILGNIGVGIFGLLIVILCVIGYLVTH